MSNAFIFPGQGSQSIGMGKELYNNFAIAKQTFQEIDDALDFSLSDMMFNGDINDLTKTQNAQPAIMANAMAVIRIIESEMGQDISHLATAVAGHSLGEYTALCAAQSLTLTQTAKLLRARGNAMQLASEIRPGAMAAILGLSISDVEQIIKQATPNPTDCVIANDNSIGQIVISGTDESVDKMIELAPSFGAKKAVKLAVSGAFHSPLMAPAVEKLQETLSTITLSHPILPIVCNITAQFEKDPIKIKDLLLQQITGTVRWTESVQHMYENNITHFIECGNGKILTGLIKRIEKQALTTNLETIEQINSFIA